jgi:ABC-type polysaccharide/polyol phosphate transport system ATPase subunit
MNYDTVIKLTNVSKKYEIHRDKPTFVEKFTINKNETYWALKKINLEIQKGERVGIIGPNGSGKTTLLKIISGITFPSEGLLEHRGRIVSLIDLEAGFHPDLSGIQNIYLQGVLLGIRKSDIKNKIRSIIKFAEINNFIAAPLYTYSSGMLLRLGFSIALYSDPNIAIIDEGLAIGDEYFRHKAICAIKQLIKRGVTWIHASHSIKIIKKTCSRIIHIENGNVIGDGGLEILDDYLKKSSLRD